MICSFLEILPFLDEKKRQRTSTISISIQTSLFLVDNLNSLYENVYWLKTYTVRTKKIQDAIIPLPCEADIKQWKKMTKLVFMIVPKDKQQIPILISSSQPRQDYNGPLQLKLCEEYLYLCLDPYNSKYWDRYLRYFSPRGSRKRHPFFVEKQRNYLSDIYHLLNIQIKRKRKRLEEEPLFISRTREVTRPPWLKKLKKDQELEDFLYENGLN